ncbi:MAG: DUF5681 domain-containing protein [Roseiarcus sp.]|jgi:hypothetical protein
MTGNSSPKKKPAGGYPVGYAKPPTAYQFQPKKSGNLKGRPKGRRTLDELLLEEIARVVKVKIGDQIVPMDKDRALQRKLIDMSIMGNIGAARLILSRLDRAQAEMDAAPDVVAPLTEEELDVLKMIAKQPGS